MASWADKRQSTSDPLATEDHPLVARQNRLGHETGLARGRRVSAALRVAPVAKPVGVQSAPETHAPTITGFQERRRRRRVAIAPMYSEALIRVLSKRDQAIDAHVSNLSETGMALEADALIPVGSPVAVEFRISGLGRVEKDGWTVFAIAGEVVRHDDVEDFPGGPYRTAIRFVQISTMMQAHIARYVATHP